MVSIIIRKELSYKIVGLLFEVHNELGRYKNEKIYADKFEHLLIRDNLKYMRERGLPAAFSGEKKNRNKPDFVIDNDVIIDFKAKRLINKEDYYQMLRYLTSYKKKLGIIVNFRQPVLKPKRIINPEIK